MRLQYGLLEYPFGDESMMMVMMDVLYHLGSKLR
jgi:hypothetical protein